MDNSIKNSLYCEKYRPQNINAYIGNEGVKSFVSKCIEEKDIPHLLLYGKPGTGKTTLAKILVNSIDCDYIYINASDERGIDTIRDKVVAFASVDGFSPLKVIILDECLEENTLVTVLREGTIQHIPIKDLNDAEDLVKSFNVKSNKVEWKPFNLFYKGERETYEIEFENGEIIICTPEHKWYVLDDEGNPKVVKTVELESYMHIYNPTGR